MGVLDGYLCRARFPARVPASPGDVLWGSLLLLAALVPTGLAILRVAEGALGHRFRLSLPERVLIAFYSAGAAFFVLASIPLDIFGTPLVLGVLSVGTAVYAAMAVRERGSALRAAWKKAVAPAGFLVGAGTLGLLIFEIAPVWNHSFPNAWDGSVTALWMNLTLRQGTLPTTLEPFASVPVVYPLATTVWMTLPVGILGWPLVQTPVLLPPLFLSLTVPAAYAWGSRWGATQSTSNVPVGLLFAGFFGLVASWPRFYTGGSYDFALALPLFLVALGLLPTVVRSERDIGPKVLAFGLLCGVLTSLSVAAGEALFVLLLAYVLVEHRKSARAVTAWLGRAAVVAVCEVVFTLRSTIVWAAQGGPAYGPSAEYGSLNLRLVEGELDPFVPWKNKMSPFPWLSLELQVLLVLGLVLAAWAARGASNRSGPTSPGRLASDLYVGAATMFGMTGALLIVALPGPLPHDLGNLTNLDQASYLLFVFFEGLCAFPLVLAVGILLERRRQPITSGGAPYLASHRSRRPAIRSARKVPLGTIAGTAAVLLLVVPLSSGAWLTVVQGFSLIEQNVAKTSNVTSGDVAAMEWIGNHLPSCSSVLVAPGSAGQFLPEYATVRIVFPMNPVPQSLPYQTAVSNLTTGAYSSDTRNALENLSVTVVLVTGQTSVSFLPFSTAPFLGSSDFSLLVSSGDASVFSFAPGVEQTQCLP